LTKRVSIKDIANKVGVSVASVSYVLNNKEKAGRVGKELAARIRKAATDLNYQPNLIARSLQSGRSWTIGLIVADISNPFFSNIARAVEDEASMHNYTVLFGSSDENAEKSQSLINTLIKRQVDALIIAPAEKTENQVRALRKINFPLVLIDRYFPAVETNSVRVDNFEASYRAVNHLFANGYRNISMVAYNTNLQHMTDRKEGFLKALKDHGMKAGKMSLLESSYEHLDTDMENIMRSALDKKTNAPDSFLFATNSLAVKGLKEISKRNIRVPDELGIVSFDESEALDFFYSPVTFINQNTTAIAKEAVNILMRQMENGRNTKTKIKPEQKIIDTTLVVRKSSGQKKMAP
jgi:LacI family transcriptional regulator